MSPTSRRWTLVVLVLVAFALRLYRLGGPEFWFDEALSANISGLGVQGVIAHLRNEPFEHPPLYFLMLYPWQNLAGVSEYAFRFFSVFWGVLFVPLLYAFLKKLADERLGLLAAILATISPFMVAYSQEARMYSLLPVLAVLLLLSFSLALKRERQPGWWLAYASLLAVGVATHYFFALLWAATTVYLLLEWPRRRPGWLWGIAVQFWILIGSAVWLIASPGFQSSLVRVSLGESAFGLTYKLNKIMPTLMLAEVTGAQIPLIAYILSLAGWALVVMGVWWSRRGRVLEPQWWRLLLIVLIVPILASLLIPYGVLGRHLGFSLVAGFGFLGLALMALARRGRVWLTAGLLVVLLYSTYGLVIHYGKTNGDLGRALAYIDERGQPGDVLVITQPSQRYLMEYYNQQSWPVRYLPDTGSAFTPAYLGSVFEDLEREHARVWLGPIGAWTADPDLAVERWLATNAFQAEKTWFPDSSSVALYYLADETLARVEIGQPTWDGSVRLERLQAGPLQISPDDAIRVRLRWRVGLSLDGRYAVSLKLVDKDGRVWAERRSEPCGGWCPTENWALGQVHRDQHALLIPPGTPPGSYHLQVAWLPLDGVGILPMEDDGERSDYLDAAKVTVLPAGSVLGSPGDLPGSMQAVFGREISLLGYELASDELKPGEVLQLETHWRAETEVANDYSLEVALTDRGGHQFATWVVPPVTDFYPTSGWRPGEYLRGQQDLPLPTTLPPDRYQIRLALVSPDGEPLPLSGTRPREGLIRLLDRTARLEGQELLLDALQVSDRLRRFDLPQVSYPLGVTVGKNATLVGYDLDLDRAFPGGEIPLTLYWKAGGPMVRPFKVFTHLVASDGPPLAQDDAPPGRGCCPTSTWTEGEVVVDQHLISLPGDLLPGTYDLVVGMYDEDTGTRLPVRAADGEKLPHDRALVRSVTVEPAVGSGENVMTPAGPSFDFDHVLFLPSIHKGNP